MTKSSPKPEFDTYEVDVLEEEQEVEFYDPEEELSQENDNPFANLPQKIQEKWQNLSFSNKLSLLIIASIALPVIAVTQGILLLQTKANKDQLLTILDRDLIALENALDNLQEELAEESETLAALIVGREINPNNPNDLTQIKNFLESSVEVDQDESFYLIVNKQGQTVAQFIQTVDEDFSQYPPLPENDEDKDGDDEEQELHEYRVISLPLGINVGQIPIIKNALAQGEELSGYELLSSAQLQPLGLASQANIGLRAQKIQGLPEAQQPYPENTYDIDGGKAGLVGMGVAPIEINGEVVGAVVLGEVINRNYEMVDFLKKRLGVSTATIFAQDWRVSTNVPYTDKETRAIGTRVSRAVADTVLNKEEYFIGEANIIGTNYLTAYGPIYDHQKSLDENAKPVGIAYVGTPLTEADKNIFRLVLTGYGIGVVVVLAGIVIANRIGKSLSQPIQELASFAKKIGSGETGLRLAKSDRTDEIGVLTQELNEMLIAQESAEESLRQEARRAGILKDISIAISRTENYHDIIGIAVEETRRALESDRVIVYTFDESWRGTIIAESVGAGWPVALGAKIHDPCFADKYVGQYLSGRVKPTENIHEAGLTECHLQQLEPFAVKANLVAPIIVSNELMGLFIAHQCSNTRQWEQGEIDLFTQIATQVGFALDRNALSEQQKKSEEEQRKEKEELQEQAFRLLMQVDPVSKGDLTIRATVTENEIGTIADSYNSTVENLRKIVTQVQSAAKEVTKNTNVNNDYMQSLSQRAIQQTQQIQTALNRVETMNQSIMMVATSTMEAEKVVQESANTVAKGDEAMNRTVEGILAIRETVAETAKKVKRLGESSQKISKVVNLINGFTDQTNLLALNASIEASHAGEEGRGFAVVAQEVRNLAKQSAEATGEIAKLVKDIQAETNEVVAAMEEGTQQVVVGTKLVDEAKNTLTEITRASGKINKLVEAIAAAAIEQSKDSEIVGRTMTQVAKIAQDNSLSANEILQSFKELLDLSQELQGTVAKFKVE